MYRVCALLGRPSEGWNEGYSLAINRGFVFPKFTPTDIATVIKRATPTAIDLIRKMIAWEPEMRPSAKECLEHPYFECMKGIVTQTH